VISHPKSKYVDWIRMRNFYYELMSRMANAGVLQIKHMKGLT